MSSSDSRLLALIKSQADSSDSESDDESQPVINKTVVKNEIKQAKTEIKEAKTELKQAVKHANADDILFLRETITALNSKLDVLSGEFNAYKKHSTINVRAKESQLDKSLMDFKNNK